MNRNFFICSVGEKNKDYSDENLKRCIDNKAHYMHKSTTHKGVFGNVKENDIVILKYADDYIAFGMVTKKYDDDKTYQDWSFAIYVKQWYFHNNTNKKKGVSRYGVQDATIEGDQYATIKQITAEFAKDRMIAIAGKDNELIKMIEKEQNMTEDNNNIVSLLSSNHNLILTGAPGTGKTYLAKQIAQQIIFGEIKEKMSSDEEKQFNEQCGFVQFHPSYDYTDFVEGLRPVQDETGNVGFERKDGVFKEFCKKALKLEACYSDLLRDISNSKNFTLKQKGGNDTTALSVDDEKRIRWIERNNPEKIASNYVSFDNLKILYEKYNTFEKLNNIENINEEIRKTIEGTADTTYYWTVLNELLHRMREKIFVFIIDEINRGEISKIFGELFFSIDPGYRGKEKGKIKTQYQNLIEQGDVFYDGFYVPENVYIIGTMNDIDRSVESMDFAFRRRFAFKEIKADDRIEMLDELLQKDKAIRRMKNLNKAIEGIEGLSTAYHIGPAYFLKLKNYNGNFQQLWENHLDGLLREYLRGMQNLEEKLKTLKAAYDNESDSDSGQQQE